MLLSRHKANRGRDGIGRLLCVKDSARGKARLSRIGRPSCSPRRGAAAARARVRIRATLEHPGQQRIRCLGGRGVLCAPTARQTNGLIGVSPENKSPRNLESIIGRVRPGNYRRNYSRFQKNSTKNSSESRARAPLPERRFPTTLDCRSAAELLRANGQQIAYVYYESEAWLQSAPR